MSTTNPTISIPALQDRAAAFTAAAEPVLAGLPDDAPLALAIREAVDLTETELVIGPSTATELFEELFKRLERLAKMTTEDALDEVADADRLLGRLRMELAGCWTEEAKALREVPLRLKINTEEQRRRELTMALRRGLGKLHTLQSDMRDEVGNGAFADRLCEIVGDLDAAADDEAGLAAIDEVFPVEKPHGTDTEIGCIDPDPEGEGDEIGDRAFALRSIAKLLPEDADGDKATVLAIADEIEGCDGCRSLWLRLNLKALDEASDSHMLTVIEYANARSVIDRRYETVDVIEDDEERKSVLDEAQSETLDLQHRALHAIAKGHPSSKLIAAAVIGTRKVVV